MRGRMDWSKTEIQVFDALGDSVDGSRHPLKRIQFILQRGKKVIKSVCEKEGQTASSVL